MPEFKDNKIIEFNIEQLQKVMQDIEKKVELIEKNTFVANEMQEEIKNAKEIISQLKRLIEYFIHIRVSQMSMEELLNEKIVKKFIQNLKNTNQKKIEDVENEKNKELQEIEEELDIFSRVSEELKNYFEKKKNNKVFTWSKEEKILSNLLSQTSINDLYIFNSVYLPFILKCEEYDNLFSTKFDEKTKNFFDEVRKTYNDYRQILPMEKLASSIKNMLEEHFYIIDFYAVSDLVYDAKEEYKKNHTVTLSTEAIKYIEKYPDLTSDTMPSKDDYDEKKQAIEKESKAKIDQINESLENLLADPSKLKNFILEYYGVNVQIQEDILKAMIPDRKIAINLLMQFIRFHENYILKEGNFCEQKDFASTFWNTFTALYPKMMEEINYEKDRQQYWEKNIVPIGKELDKINKDLKEIDNKIFDVGHSASLFNFKKKSQLAMLQKSKDSLKLQKSDLENQAQQILKEMEKAGFESFSLTNFSDPYENKLENVKKDKKRELLRIDGYQRILRCIDLDPDEVSILTLEQMAQYKDEYIAKFQKRKTISLENLNQLLAENQKFFQFISNYLGFNLFDVVNITEENLISVQNLISRLQKPKNWTAIPQMVPYYESVMYGQPVPTEIESVFSYK